MEQQCTLRTADRQPEEGRIRTRKGSGVCSRTRLWKGRDRGGFGGRRCKRDRQKQWYVNVWICLQGIEPKPGQVTDS